MNFENRIFAFTELGRLILKTTGGPLNADTNSLEQKCINLQKLITNSRQYNGWFTPENVKFMLESIATGLDRANLLKWLNDYLLELESNQKAQKKIGIVMAGNIPAVGFHDFLSVLITGNSLMAKLSRDDNKLLPAIADLLIEIEPQFTERIVFTDNTLDKFDAVIATGSDNSKRYFEFYFGKYPHLIRHNRNGVAILTGDETEKELTNLADDITMYFGLGCRNVSKLMVPENYNFSKLLEIIGKKHQLSQNNKYFNNYEYNKAIFLINRTPHFDSGNLLLVKVDRISSPVGVVNYDYYSDTTMLNSWIKVNQEHIQCLVGKPGTYQGIVNFGHSQLPELWEYADGIDTVRFLLDL